MTTDIKQDITETENAAFDSTLKIGGIVVALVVVAVLAVWLFQ